MRRRGLERRAIPEYFGPYLPFPMARADLLVRVKGDPLSVAPAVRRAILEIIPSTLVFRVSTAEQDLGDFSAQRRFQTGLLTAFAVLALLLAGVGIYGVVHYTVAERTKEIGVRVALGAAPADVIGLVVGQGMRMPGLGILLGLVASAGLTRVVSHLLFDVAATDPITFVGVGALLAGVAVLASYFPARRAASLDPVRALRQE
jgi:putative ABC transport system permease protein